MALNAEQRHLLENYSIDEIKILAEGKDLDRRNAVGALIHNRNRVKEVKTSIKYHRSRKIPKHEIAAIVDRKMEVIAEYQKDIRYWTKDRDKLKQKRKDAKTVMKYIIHESEKINEWRRREALKRQRQTMGGQGALSSYIGSGLRKDKYYDDREKLDEVGEYRLWRALQKYKVAPEIAL